MAPIVRIGRTILVILSLLLVIGCLNPITDPPLSYLLRFDANGAVGELDPPYPVAPAFVSVQTGDGVVIPGQGTLVNGGMLFAGWNTRVGGGGDHYLPGSVMVMPGRDVTLYAQWDALPTYGITYDANGGIGAVPTDAGSYYDGQAITIAGQDALTNGTELFAGWNTAGDGSGAAYAPGPNIMPAGALALYAQWSAVPTYNITYDANGGINPPTDGTPYLDGDPVNVLGPGAMTRAGYQFANWNTADNGSGATYNAGDIYTIAAANVTLYAAWTQIDYQIMFDANGGTGTMASQFVVYGGSVTLTSNTDIITRVDHRFMGWSDTAVGFVDWNDGALYSHAIEGNRTLYAVWEPTYTVTYTALNATTGTPPTDLNEYVAGDLVEVLGNLGTLARSGHTFSGWTDGFNNYVASNDFSMPAAHVVLDPIWIPDATYTVTYDGGDHTGGAPPLDDNSYLAGVAVTPEVLGDLVRLQDGISLRFTGWNQTGGGGGIRQPGVDFTMPAENITLQAMWDMDVIGATGPGGGMVFHDKGFISEGWRYLEAAPVGTQFLTIWGDGTVETFVSDTAVGAGKLNTGRNVAVMQGYNGGLYASRQAQQVSSLGLTDWFLPSRDELEAMYSSLHVNVWGDFSNAIYWSSTEAGATGAVTFDFSTGTPNSEGKGIDELVRAARAFRSPASTHLVIYAANGAIGAPPLDPYHYEPGDFVTLQNSGDLSRTGYTFAGWNTQPDDSGTFYPEGLAYSFNPGDGNLVLYARWSPFDGGYGTEGNPYQVATATQLDRVRDYLDAHFIQTANIDLGVAPWNDLQGWVPIGNTTTQFSGNYNGDGFAISNLTIYRINGQRQGLFGDALNATLTDLHIINAQIDASGGMFIGPLAGYAQSTNITGSSASGVIIGGQSVGGLVGNMIFGFLTDSKSTANVSGTQRIGGLLGNTSGSVLRSYATGSVAGTVAEIGGFVGQNGGRIEDSYATGAVSGEDSNRVGGFIGYHYQDSIRRSYSSGAVTGTTANIGGFAGENGVTITDSYYDSTTSGQSDVGKGTPLTTAQMVNSANFSGFTFGTTWTIDEGTSYPFLLWQGAVDIPIP